MLSAYGLLYFAFMGTHTTSLKESQSTARVILIAEGNAELRQLFAVALEHEGHRVFQVATGGELLALVQRMAQSGEHGGTVDLIVSGAREPDGTEIEPVQRLRDQGFDIPIVLTTALGDPWSRANAAHYGIRSIVCAMLFPHSRTPRQVLPGTRPKEPMNVPKKATTIERRRGTGQASLGSLLLAFLSLAGPASAESGTGQRVLSLAAAERAALTGHPQLQLARTQTQVASSRVDQARAGYLPQLTVTASYQRTTGNFSPRPGTTVATATGSWTLNPAYDLFNVGLGAQQLLYDFGQASSRISAAEAIYGAQASTERVVKLQVTLAVRRAYYQASAQKSLLGVARESLENQRRHLAQIQGFVTVGTRPNIDLVQARSDVANAQYSLTAAQGAFDASRAQLNQAAGLMADTDYDVMEEAPAPLDDEDQPLQALVDKALAARPEFVALERQRVAQEAAIRAGKGAYGPTLSAQAGATEAGIALNNMVPNWNVGVALAWPIFQGGLTRAQVREAELGLDTLSAQRNALVLPVQLDVDQARLVVRSAKAGLEAAQSFVANARERLRLAEGRYTQGVGSIIELSDAQLAATNASAQLVQARFTLASARAQLLGALGRP